MPSSTASCAADMSIMRTAKFLFLAFIICFTFPLFAQQKNLTPEDQAKFLHSRTNRFISGTFDSVCSYLYAARDVAIHTDSKRINSTRVESTFPQFYSPTWQELFDMIAWQTMSSWKYDPTLGYWVFRESQRVLPFHLDVVDGWQPEHHSIEVVYRPKIAPVGMDVYWLGSYSTDGKDPHALFKRVREDLALSFVMGYVKDVTAKEMRTVQIGGYEALYYETNKTPNGIVWRQWVVVDKGQGIAIVSAIEPKNEKKLLPDVLAMVKSLQIIGNETAREITPDARMLQLIGTAVSIIRAIHEQNLVGYLAVLVDDDNVAVLQKDGDVGPFLRFREHTPKRNAVVLFSGDKNPKFCVYFEDATPTGTVVLQPGPKVNIKDIEAGYKPLPQELKSPVQGVKFDKGTVNTDDGQPVTTFVVKKIE